jgi:hypothetical protein
MAEGELLGRWRTIRFKRAAPAQPHEPRDESRAGFFGPEMVLDRPVGEWSGGGEDDPIWSSRLQRDGWKLTAYPEKTKDDYGAKVWIEYDPPIVWEKEHPLWPDRYILRMSILGIKERDGNWYIVEHSVIGEKGQIDEIGRSEWADWSRDGDLLFAQSGCLYRLRPSKRRFGPIENSEQIADFNNLGFERVEPPASAQSWSQRGSNSKKNRSRR